MNNLKKFAMAAAAAALVSGVGITGAAMAQTATPPAQQGSGAQQQQAAPQNGQQQRGGPNGGQMGGPGGRGGKGGGGMQASAPVTVTGAISEYTINPMGDYDGFALNDGTKVDVPPDAALEVKAKFAVGASVTVVGNQHPSRDGNATTEIRAQTITSGSTSYTVTPPTTPPAHTAPVTATVSGAITEVVTDTRGFDGFYLGANLKIDAHVPADVAAKLTVGANVEVTGDKHEGNSGLVVVRAQEIKINGAVVWTAPAGRGGKGGPGGPGGRGGHGPMGDPNGQMQNAPQNAPNNQTNPANPGA